VSYFIYCVFRGPLPAALEIPNGVGGYRVFTANYNGLGAALSKLAEPEAPPDTSNLLAFERVVESFYRHLTVIPMRYGRRVGCPYDAVILLRENHDAYCQLLHELEGLAEVGIQVFLDNPGARAETDRPGILPEWFPLRSSVSGAAYLDAKKLSCQGAQRAATVQNALVENLCDSLHGSFVRHKVELASSNRSRLLSLHFLVPRDSVESFRRAARQLPANPSVKLLLGSPSPPYNFVDALRP
jgi:hypothetical protein